MKYLEKKSVFILAQIVLVSVMLHASFRSGFHDIDDRAFIAPVTQDNWTEVLWKYSVPVVVVSYRIDYLLFDPFITHRPLSPAVQTYDEDIEPQAYVQEALAPPMRTMSAVYHIASGFLLWLFLRRLRVGSGIAFLAALLWTGHPVNCENVCWIMERKTVLCALFGFGALLVWTYNQWWRLPLFNLLFALSFLAKASALGFLPLIVVLEVLAPPDGRTLSWRTIDWRRLLSTLAGPVLISAAFMLPNLSTFKSELVEPPGGNVFTALLTDAEIFFRYAHHTLFPFRLTFFNSVEPIVSLADIRFWLYGSAMLLISAVFFVCTEREQRPLTVLGCLWFFSALGPHSNLMAIPFWMQDRYVALGMPGLLISAMLAAKGLAQRYPRAREWLPGLATGYALLFTALLAYRATFYVNTEVLELDAALHQPRSAFARINGARIFRNRMVKNAPDGQTPNAERFKLAAQATIFHLQGAMGCPDILNFFNDFELRVAMASVYQDIGEYAEANRTLHGWLPPPGMKMNEKYETAAAALRQGVAKNEYWRGYRPRTLAWGWTIAAECSLQMAIDPKITREAARALLEQSVHESTQSMILPHRRDKGRLLKATALVHLSNLDRGQSRLDDARQKTSDAVELLKQVAPESSLYATAKDLLTRIQQFTPLN